MRLAALHLRAADAAALAGFYRDTLGMTAGKRGEAWHVGYGGPDADLILHAGDVGDPEILDRLEEIAPTREGAWTHVAGSFIELADQLGC